MLFQLQSLKSEYCYIYIHLADGIDSRTVLLGGIVLDDHMNSSRFCLLIQQIWLTVCLAQLITQEASAGLVHTVQMVQLILQTA